MARRRNPEGDATALTVPVTEMEVLGEPAFPTPTRRRTQPHWLQPDSPVLVYAGVGLVAAGIALVGYTWLRVSGLLSVPLQLPYVASSGFTGVGFVVLGSLVVNIMVKRRDAALRAAQLEELSTLLAGISMAMDGRRGPAT